MERRPRRLSSKEATRQAGDSGSIPGPGRSAGEGSGNPLWYSRLENSTDRGAGGVQPMRSQRRGSDLLTKQQQLMLKSDADVSAWEHWLGLERTLCELRAHGGGHGPCEGMAGSHEWSRGLVGLWHCLPPGFIQPCAQRRTLPARAPARRGLARAQTPCTCSAHHGTSELAADMFTRSCRPELLEDMEPAGPAARHCAAALPITQCREDAPEVLLSSNSWDNWAVFCRLSPTRGKGAG